MPFASKSALAADTTVVGADGRMGDIKSHIFRIDTSSNDYTTMFATDLIDGKDYVVTDGNGDAAVTLDFACLRCHNGIGSASLKTLGEASTMAPLLH